jgi:hypothetical protein
VTYQASFPGSTLTCCRLGHQFVLYWVDWPSQDGSSTRSTGLTGRPKMVRQRVLYWVDWPSQDGSSTRSTGLTGRPKMVRQRGFA